VEPLAKYYGEWIRGLIRVQSGQKKPLDTEWASKALEFWQSDDQEAFAEHALWLQHHIGAGGNLGLSPPPGVVILDADSTAAVKELDFALSDMPKQIRDNADCGSAHFAARTDRWAEIRNGIGMPLTLNGTEITVDVRVPGKGQAVCWPSIHPSGGRYMWERRLPDFPADVPQLPLTLEEQLVGGTAAFRLNSANGRHVKGERHGHLLSATTAIAKRGEPFRKMIHELPALARQLAPAPGDDSIEIAARILGLAGSALDKADLSEVEAPELRPLVPLTGQEVAMDTTPEHLIEGLVHRAGITLVTGRSKGGKSVLGNQAAMAVCAGAPFLGLKTRKSRVLLISLEMAAAIVRDRMQSISKGTCIPMPRFDEELFFVGHTAGQVVRLPLGDDEQEWGRLKVTIQETGADLVVLDTLHRFLGGLDPNDNAAMSGFFGRLDELCVELKVGVLVIDYVAKGGGDGVVSQSALGATTKGGTARTVASLSRTKGAEGPLWTLDAESHFGNWDEPITYQQPVDDGGQPVGIGCVRCDDATGRGLTLEALVRAFEKHGEDAGNGMRRFPSGNVFFEALKAEGLVKTDGQAAKISTLNAVRSRYCVDRDAEERIRLQKPIWTSQGPRRATVFDLVPSVANHLLEPDWSSGPSGPFGVPKTEWSSGPVVL